MLHRVHGGKMKNNIFFRSIDNKKAEIMSNLTDKRHNDKGILWIFFKFATAVRKSFACLATFKQILNI